MKAIPVPFLYPQPRSGGRSYQKRSCSTDEEGERDLIRRDGMVRNSPRRRETPRGREGWESVGARRGGGLPQCLDEPIVVHPTVVWLAVLSDEPDDTPRSVIRFPGRG